MAKEENGKKKLSYGELENLAKSISEQNGYFKRENMKLVQKVRELSDFSMSKRLDYLFKVVENSDKFNSDFVITCTEEIQEMIYPKQAPEEQTEQESKGEE